ncbi:MULTISPECIES: hypothetical protein [Protofrankia]|uniref:Uncharacterized protein n=1 Tax=Protofrankia coriariae TaxID=1562887 RepID=A0ABR5F2M1_9ACTN|nr:MULTISPECIES: hypothetical protein [Protofrankia]KLL10973.1 hypothetical protein FrCorBMG51_14540 [Protofrankia coriariae]ONH37691.1 hypothetical protein BL254_02035 [Protofrankia sp. BMG5.30]
MDMTWTIPLVVVSLPIVVVLIAWLSWLLFSYLIFKRGGDNVFENIWKIAVAFPLRDWMRLIRWMRRPPNNPPVDQ